MTKGKNMSQMINEQAVKTEERVDEDKARVIGELLGRQDGDAELAQRFGENVKDTKEYKLAETRRRAALRRSEQERKTNLGIEDRHDDARKNREQVERQQQIAEQQRRQQADRQRQQQIAEQQRQQTQQRQQIAEQQRQEQQRKQVQQVDAADTLTQQRDLRKHVQQSKERSLTPQATATQTAREVGQARRSSVADQIRARDERERGREHEGLSI